MRNIYKVESIRIVTRILTKRVKVLAAALQFLKVKYLFVCRNSIIVYIPVEDQSVLEKAINEVLKS